MNINQLLYFKALAESNHLINTANALHISPPALRAAIKSLEYEFDCILFDHMGRQIKVNENGRILLSHIDSILSEIKEAKKEINNNKAVNLNRIKIGVTSPTLWHNLIKEFVRRYPETIINYTLLDEKQINKYDIINNMDFIITGTDDITSSNWNSARLIVENPLYIGVNKNHKLANKESVSLYDLVNEKLILPTADESFYKYIKNVFSSKDFYPTNTIECDFSLRKILLECNYGVVITSQSVINTGELGNIKYIKISDAHCSRSYSLFWNKNNKLNNASKNFLNLAMSQYKVDNNDFY